MEQPPRTTLQFSHSKHTQFYYYICIINMWRGRSIVVLIKCNLNNLFIKQRFRF